MNWIKAWIGRFLGLGVVALIGWQGFSAQVLLPLFLLMYAVFRWRYNTGVWSKWI